MTSAQNPRRRSPLPRFAVRAVAAAAILAGLGMAALRLWPESHWRPGQARLEERYGIKVLLQDIVFPPSFRAQQARYRLTLPFERASVLERLGLDLSRYPPALVRDHVREIVVLRSLELNGLPYGGTYDIGARRVYLDSDWLGDDGGRPEAMGLHHEISSLLMHLRPDVFRGGAWDALNPGGFRYRFGASTGANLRTDQLDLIGSPELWGQGFLCGYGQLTLEDDINTFAQYLVAGKKRWRELEPAHPRLAAKMNLLRSWYREIGFVEPP